MWIFLIKNLLQDEFCNNYCTCITFGRGIILFAPVNDVKKQGKDKI